jgi:PAS domain S-box-containing protein
MTRPQILIVEDDPVISMLLRNRLTKLGYQITGMVSTGEEAITLVKEHAPDLALMDIKLDGPMDGVETARQLRILFDVPVIYATAYTDEALLNRAREAEPLGYLVKPYGERELRSVIEMALYKNRMEKSLKASEAKFRNLAEAAPFGISIMAHDNAFDYFNAKFTDIFGYTIEDLPDQSEWLNKACPNEKDGASNETDPKGPDATTLRVTCKDRTRKTIGFREVTLENGLRIGTYQDITAEIAAQEEILRAKNQWELTFDAVSDCIMILDDNHRILRLNRAMIEALKIQRNEAIGKRCYEIVHGQTIPLEECPHTKVLENGSECQVEVAEDRLGGIFDVRVSPIRIEGGSVVGSVHTARDITERKQNERRLRQANEFQQQLLDTAATAIFTVDSGRKITGVNSEFCQMSGYGEKELIGATCSDFMGEQCIATCALNSSGQSISKSHAKLRAKDGRILTVMKNAPQR